ncbi:MAG: hypothetical protein OXI17_06760 [Gammaproteobacteria bacterium]|nr:hypothetical protein [Gammaproteobacteria bacterium]
MLRIILFSLLLAAPGGLALAQHSHGVLSPGVTFPPDDSVLSDPPRMITMSFRVDVRLLKLALYTSNEEWVDIGFIYDPERVGQSFVYPIPFELPSADYYIARWSVTDDQRARLLNGEFKFAFGNGAIPPSEFIDSLVSELEEVLPDTGAYRIGIDQ